MYLVCRWRDQEPLSKRVVTVPGVSVLDWFRDHWDMADPRERIDAELGDVYGLDSVFEEARARRLPPPATVDELRDLLHRHLYVEADDVTDHIRLGAHALRVRTDDDEVDLAYYFVDDEAVAALPDRLAFLVHDTWPLPGDAYGAHGADGAGGAAGPGAEFRPTVPVRTVRLGVTGPETTFSVRLGWDAPDTGRTLDLAGAVSFPGVALPDLAGHLRTAPVARWPHEVRLLRDLVAPHDGDLEPAMRRYASLSGYAPEPGRPADPPGPGTGGPADAERGASLVRVDPHLVQVARYIDDFFGYDQWFLFDTRWAAAHPDLARSLLRYAVHWDPFQP
ncbi:hypothetical protein [Virgisporangium ochraceum]|uniref:Uncharacterized protein n=1 Tax=Virgisporangium ochraceum TaxID=65505 RepID=A0A8J4EEY3_9ACTN|nr:hypothetical protein [Virgisporangium ochraceum]GIJ72249.1 hypothetical protein Voc01_071660 [Virgisporangium ochraceum]